MNLGNVAIIRSGLVLSRKETQDSNCVRYQALNLRSINADGYIEFEKLDQYNAIEKLNPEYLSQIGDVIVRLTSPYTAVLIDEQTAGMVISSNFVIIRTDKQKVLPEYLYWLLNTSPVKRKIFANTSSNMLGAIHAKYFVDMPIPTTSIQDQRKIAEINSLAKRERQLLLKLVEEKEALYSRLIDQVQKDIRRQ